MVVGRYLKRSIGFGLLLLFAISYIVAARPMLSDAETVYVKYRGSVDLSSFECAWITRSSFIKRLCYDARENYVIVNLNGTYYHYCEVPSGIVADWRNAESMGRFLNTYVKGRYDCRVLRVPAYKN